MEELVNRVSQQTGLPQESARQAVDTVLGFLKERLPAPIAGQIDSVLGGGGQTGQGGMPGGFGNPFDR
jgi:hypothetical protein